VEFSLLLHTAIKKKWLLNFFFGFFPDLNPSPTCLLTQKLAIYQTMWTGVESNGTTCMAKKRLFLFGFIFVLRWWGEREKKKEKFYFKEFETKVKLWRRKRRSRMGWCCLLTGGIAPF
jgi:hypothetical protein